MPSTLPAPPTLTRRMLAAMLLYPRHVGVDGYLYPACERWIGILVAAWCDCSLGRTTTRPDTTRDLDQNPDLRAA